MKNENLKNWILTRLAEEEKDFGENSKQTLQDIVNNGMAGGFLDLVYIKDTVNFYNDYVVEIWQIVSEKADEQNLSEMEFITQSDFSEHIADQDTLANYLCWFAVEVVADRILQELEEEEQQEVNSNE